jgi:hypothetical protein
MLIDQREGRHLNRGNGTDPQKSRVSSIRNGSNGAKAEEREVAPTSVDQIHARMNPAVGPSATNAAAALAPNWGPPRLS